MQRSNIVSAWTRQVENGQKPDSSDLQDHLTAIHQENAGFTEALASKCRDSNGKNSYELLADVIDQDHHSKVLDLACGSGVLLDLCNKRFDSKVSFAGIDISNAELKLASERLIKTDIVLHQSMAQGLDFIADMSVDVILCHWALTLMDPIIPVLKTIKRILKHKGIFAAIVDGDGESAPGYREIHNIIYTHAQRKYSNYGTIELGDARVRKTDKLLELAGNIFVDFDIKISPFNLSFSATPEILARETAGFFYASFVLSAEEHCLMLRELENHFFDRMENGESCFTLPVNLLMIKEAR